METTSLWALWGYGDVLGDTEDGGIVRSAVGPGEVLVLVNGAGW